MSRPRPGRGPAAGPGRRKGYAYLGPFTVHGELIVADRCYVGSRRPDLAHRFPAKAGAWHAWTRADPEETGMTALLIAAHEDHLALANKGWCRWDDVPRIGADVAVDTATVAFVDAARFDSDRSFRRAIDDALYPEDVQAALGPSGCVASSGLGDGLYPLGVETSRGVAVALQVGFVLDEDEDDEAGPDGAEHAAPVTKAGKPRRRLGTGPTPLHAAVADGDIKQVRQLLAAGARVNALDERGRTAAYLAATRGDARILACLRDAGANLLARDDVGETALFSTAFNGYSSVVALLLVAGADPNDRAGPVRATPLHAAAMGDQARVVAQLLAAGARVSTRDSCDYTPLMCAASQSSVQAARVLLAHGPGNNENEALLIAAAEGHLDLVKTLIAGGADPNYRSKYGKTALMHARMSKRRRARAVVKLLASITSATADHAASTGPVVEEEGATDG